MMLLCVIFWLNVTRKAELRVRLSTSYSMLIKNFFLGIYRKNSKDRLCKPSLHVNNLQAVRLCLCQWQRTMKTQSTCHVHDMLKQCSTPPNHVVSMCSLWNLSMNESFYLTLDLPRRKIEILSMYLNCIKLLKMLRMF